ncbi:MAG: DUF4440 domain-containing protein [Caulobacter sp.]|nr:DUF4440 domain-containing protein [Caulobacter sp.]
MTEADVQDFVTRFAAAWAARDGEAFARLWDPEGVLTYPFIDRPLKGSQIAALNAAQNAQAPDLVWQLLDWTWRGDVVIIEWQSTRAGPSGRFDWRGVDKIRLKDGLIVEETVYSDTGPLRAMRAGEALTPLLVV